MKKLILENSVVEPVQVGMKHATCNFCGEQGKLSVRGAFPIRQSEEKMEEKHFYAVEVDKGQVESVEILTKWEVNRSMFSTAWRNIVETEHRIVNKNPLKAATVFVPTGEHETIESPVDICLDCVRQLEKLTRGLKQTKIADRYEARTE